MTNLAIQAKELQERILGDIDMQLNEIERLNDVTFTPRERASHVTQFVVPFVSEVMKGLVQKVSSYPADSVEYQFSTIFTTKMISSWKAAAANIGKSETEEDFQRLMIESIEKMVAPSPVEQMISGFVHMPLHDNVRTQLLAARDLLAANDLSQFEELQDELPLIF